MTIFPELSLNGYLLKDEFIKDAFSFKEIKEEFSKHKKDFILSFALKENNYIYNASGVFINGGLCFIHRKINLPNYNMFEEKRYFTKGDKLDTFIWRDKKCLILICEDAWYQDNIKKLENDNIDYVFIQSNSPARGFKDNLEIETKWLDIQKKISIKLNAHTFFINRIGFEDGIGFWGGSKATNNNGKIIDSLEVFKSGILDILIK
jgi:predicted amidohydrolase